MIRSSGIAAIHVAESKHDLSIHLYRYSGCNWCSRLFTPALAQLPLLEDISCGAGEGLSVCVAGLGQAKFVARPSCQARASYARAAASSSSSRCTGDLLLYLSDGSQQLQMKLGLVAEGTVVLRTTALPYIGASRVRCALSTKPCLFRSRPCSTSGCGRLWQQRPDHRPCPDLPMDPQ